MKRISICGALLSLISIAPGWCADIAGQWQTVVGRGAAGLEVDFTFVAQNSRLTGTMTDSHGESVRTDGHIQGDKLSFAILYDLDGHELRVNYQGKVQGDEVNLTYSWPNGVNRTLRLKRLPADLTDPLTSK